MNELEQLHCALCDGRISEIGEIGFVPEKLGQPVHRACGARSTMAPSVQSLAAYIRMTQSVLRERDRIRQIVEKNP